MDSRNIYKAPKKSVQDAKAADAKMQDVSPQMKKSAKASKEDKKSQEKPVSEVCKPKKIYDVFILFSIENRLKLLKVNPNLTMGEIGKQNAIDWKNITESHRKKIDALRDKDAIRYNREMKEFQETGFYTNSDGSNSKFMDKKHRVKEFPIGTVMPKGVKSAYVIYFTEFHLNLKAQKKEGEKYDVVENTKKISEGWNTMTAVKKAKYEKLQQKDQERYNKQLDEIRKKGFYMTDDGIKSTDLPEKKKKVKKTKRVVSSATKE
jgi:hypothetical protein